MVDLENTHSAGLDGVEFLTRGDAVTIFFSQSALCVQGGKLDALAASGCALDICKLLNTGKNALDFYIASRIGEEFGRGYTGVAAIVSKDTGFAAICDYWRERTSKPRVVVLRPSIEQCILAADTDEDRKQAVHDKLKDVSIEQMYASYKRGHDILAAISSAIGEESDAADRALALVEGRKVGRELYLDVIRTFGLKRGREIYAAVKPLL